MDDTRQYPTNNATALVAFVSAFIPVPFLTGVVAIVLGIASLQEIRRTAQTARPVAVAAIVLGAINLVAWVFPFLFFGGLVSAFTHTTTGGTSFTGSQPVASAAPTAAPTVAAAPVATPPATPATAGGAPAAGGVWVCRSGVTGNSSTTVPSPDCQGHEDLFGGSGNAFRVYVKPLTPYYHCGHWNVHELHLDGNPDGINANTVHYDQDWNQVPGGAC